MRRIRFPLHSMFAGLLVLACAAPVLAEDMILNDFSAENGSFRFSAPKVEITGTPLSKAEIEALFKGGTADAAIARIGTFNATKVAVGELTVEQRLTGDPNPTAKRLYVFKDISLGNIKNGMAATTAMGSARLTSSGEEINFGSTRLVDLDAGFLLKLLLQRASAETAPKALLGEGTLESFSYSKPEGSVTIASIALKGLRYQPGDAAPHMFRLAGRVTTGAWKAVVSPSASDPGSQWALKSFGLQAEAVKEGVPSQFSAKAEGLVLDKNLLAKRGFSDLGYETLVASAAIEGGYDPKKQDLNFKTASISIENFGSMTLSGLIGKVTPDTLLSGKALGSTPATVKSMSLRVVNDGLYDRVVQREAKKTGKSVEDTRTRLSAQGRAIVVMMMGVYPSNPLIEALIRFAGAPGTLDVSSTSTSAEGFPIADFNKKDDKGPLIIRGFNVKASAR